MASFKKPYILSLRFVPLEWLSKMSPVVLITQRLFQKVVMYTLWEIMFLVNLDKEISQLRIRIFPV